MSLTPLPAPFTPLAFTQLVSNFVRNLVRSSGQTINVSEGSIMLALAEAAAINDSFIQSQVLQVGLASRATTASGPDLDSFVNQFVPPFTSRLAAVAASSIPGDPTYFAADANNSGYVLVQSINNLLVNQQIQVTEGANSATGTITAIQPTTTLTQSAASGTTTLNVTSTVPAYVTGQVSIVDGIYSTTATITGVSGNVLNIQPLTSSPVHTFASGSVVTYLDAVQVSITNWSSIYSSYKLGTKLWLLNMLQGEEFYRFSTDQSTPAVPVGYQLLTPDNVAYTVIADNANPWFNTTLQQYIFRPQDLNIFVPVQAVVAGTASNILANTLTNMPTPITGINGATNLYAIQTGTNAETDSALLSRFQNFISGLARGTKQAVLAAVEGVQAGVSAAILENVAIDGVTSQPGNFVVIAADANGNLGSTLFNQIFTAIDITRPLTTTFNLEAPTVDASVIAMILKVASGSSIATVTGTVQTNIFNSFTGQAPGSTLYFNSLVNMAMSVAGVLDVLQCTVNGNGWSKPNNDAGQSSDVFTIIGAGPVDVLAAATHILRPTMPQITITGSN